MTAPQISAKAASLIEGFEIGSRAEYDPRLSWPGGASGITGGVGYDFGWEATADIRQDWAGLLPPSVLTRLQSCSGRTGAAASSMLHLMGDIRIPCDAAIKVFEQRNLPRYTGQTIAAFPNAALLPPDCLGALVSLVFNRGAAMADPPGYPNSRLEMREIRDAIAARHFAAVPGFFRAMKRLWSNGLVARREAEADLFEAGLASLNQGA